MDRQDLLWIALKVAGLYLITEGVLFIPDAIVTGGLVNQLDAIVPVLAGCLLLGIRVATVARPEAAERPSVLGGMSRGDWFWLVCKTLGLWWTVHALLQVPTTIRFFTAGATDTFVVVSVGIYLAAGLGLLLSNALPRMVARMDKRVGEAAAVSRFPSTGAAQQGAAADDRPQAGDRG
jgi:hypothetical protein